MAMGIDTSDRLVDRFRRQLKVGDRVEGGKAGDVEPVLRGRGGGVPCKCTW
jgi:hypothetical protein